MLWEDLRNTWLLLKEKYMFSWYSAARLRLQVLTLSWVVMEWQEPKVQDEWNKTRPVFACSAKGLVLYSEVSGNHLKALRPRVAWLDLRLRYIRSASRVGDGMWGVRPEAVGQRSSGSCNAAPFHSKGESPESIRIIHISDSNNNNLNLINPFFSGAQDTVKFVIKHSLSTPPYDLHTLCSIHSSQSARSLGFEAADPASRTHVSYAGTRETLDCSPRHQKLRSEVIPHLTWWSCRQWGRFPGIMATLKWPT